MRRLPFVFALAAAASVPALAQETEILSDFLACDAMSAPAERLTCFDATLKQYKLKYGLLNSSPEAVAKADEGRSRAVPQPRVAAEDIGAAYSGSGAKDRQAGQEDTSSGGRDRKNSDRARIAAAKVADGDFSAVIVAVEKSVLGYLVFTLDNGQVWRETDGSPLPQGNMLNKTARFDKNFIGGWRMKIDGVAGFARVKLERESTR